jgi:hypothetical protein
LSGENRYETSVKIAEFGWPTASSLTSGKVYLASGEEFGPGLIAGAAAGRVDSPVLLSQTRFLSTVLANEIRRLKPSQVVQVGYGTGPGNISTSISSAASELVGASRVIIYETTLNDLSVTVAEQTPNRGLLAPVVVLVSSENFPDALAAGAAAGSAAMPLLMSSKSCLPKNVSDQISRYQTSSLLVVGLAAAVSDSTANGLICSAVPPTSTAPPQTSSPTATSGLPANTTQGIIYGTYGCKNQIQMGALSYAGQVVSTKVLVQSTQNVQLIPYGLSPSNELLFSSYNCDSRTYSVYRQQLGANPTLRLVMSLPSTWGIIGGTWDVARNAPAVLLRDPNFAYSIQVHNGSGWSVAASFPRNSFGTYYPTGLQSLSGFEYRIWGSSTSAWKVWRLGSAGYLSEILNGAGYLNSVSSAPLERSLALLSSSGTWICEGYANGSISILIGQGKCSSATNATARYAAFTYANSDAASFWLHLIPSGISGTSRLKVICRLSSLLNCEGPSIQERQVGVISGNNPLTVSLFSLPNFNQLAPTNVP